MSRNGTVEGAAKLRRPRSSELTKSILTDPLVTGKYMLKNKNSVPNFVPSSGNHSEAQCFIALIQTPMSLILGVK